MNLAIVSPYPPSITGIGQYGYYVSRLLAHSGLFSRISVLTGWSKEMHGLDIHPVIDIQSGWRPESLAAGLEIVSSLRRIRPDLVWFNLGASIFGRSPLANLSGFFSPLLSRGMGFPSVVTLHELVELADLRALKSPGGPLAPVGARLLTRVALQGDVTCLTMQRYVKLLAANHTVNRFMHIPIGAYHKPEWLPPPTARSREILFFTTLAPYKGLEILLEAFQSLKGEYPDLSLAVAGADHTRFPGYSQRLRQSTAHLDGIRWLGQVSEAEVRDLYQAAQIVCIPYTASTGSSSVLYQAAMWGRPIIASDLAETQSLARENSLEVAFFKSGSAVSLAKTLKSLLDSPDLRLAQVTRNFAAIQIIRPEEICQAYLRAFNMALATHLSPKRIPIPPLAENSRPA
jgi:glycosyltransferase involved in cell wall biosynthesis